MRFREQDGADSIEIECPDHDREFVTTHLYWFRSLKKRQREIARFRADIAASIEVKRQQLLKELADLR